MIQAPRGTKDLYGQDTKAWQWLESHIREICGIFGFGEIRAPIFEHTELFLRGVGDTTDIVQKEMYTFNDKGGRSITLRPELTAGVARGFIEHGLHNEPMPAKFFYTGPIFRYERPQEGRLRQHHQFGIEVFGSFEPAAEVEVMALGYFLLKRLGISDTAHLYINSLGCKSCFTEYGNRLRAFIGDNLQNMCEDCKRRFEKNPLRTLDCKVDKCKGIMASAPSVLDSLDEECSTHFKTVQALLTGMGIPFTVDPKIVRGLDYYTRTVFEFIAEGLPTVIGGGRYDGLVEQIGGNPIPAAGFGMGMDRLLILLKNEGLLPTDLTMPCDIYVGHAGDAGYKKSQALAYELKSLCIAAESDLLKRSVKAQMKYAGKRGAKFSMIIGDNEIAENSARIKNMETGEQKDIPLNAAEIRKELNQ